MTRQHMRVPAEPRWGGQPPWNPRGRVAVVVDDRFWAGTVTGVDRAQIAVMADNGVHRWYHQREVYSLKYADQFLTGRIIGHQAKATGWHAILREEEATAELRAAATVEQDLIALRRG